MNYSLNKNNHKEFIFRRQAADIGNSNAQRRSFVHHRNVAGKKIYDNGAVYVVNLSFIYKGNRDHTHVHVWKGGADVHPRSTEPLNID